MPRYVYAFDDPCDSGRELLGGKGAGLAEMTLLGIPVPTGFTITTEACRAYMKEKRLPDGLEEEVAEQLRLLEERAGKRSAIRPTRCSSRCARARRSRCPG